HGGEDVIRGSVQDALNLKRRVIPQGQRRTNSCSAAESEWGATDPGSFLELRPSMNQGTLVHSHNRDPGAKKPAQHGKGGLSALKTVGKGLNHGLYTGG